MGSRRSALAPWVIAGGLLAAGVLPMGFIGVAFADDAADSSVFDPLFQEFFGFERDATQPATVYSISGEPPIFQSIHETEIFQTGAAGMLSPGSFQVDDEVITTAFGPASAELLVTSSDAATGAPPVGSVYDVINIGGGFENVYSDIPSTTGGADALSDTLVTPFGGIPLMTKLHAFLDPTDSFYLYGGTDPPTDLTDPTASTDATTEATSFFNPSFQEFFGFEPTTSQPIVTDIAAILPLYQSVHQTVSFDTAAGSFQADENVLAHASSPGFAELAVTSSDGNAPPVGSVYEINNIGNGFENVYSDVAPTTPGGTDVLSDTLVTPIGNIPIMVDFHAYFDSTYSFFPYDPADPSPVDPTSDTAGFDPTQPFAFFGFTHDMSQPSTVTAVSGLSGVNGSLPDTSSLFNSVHLNEFFDTSTGSFQADSNVITNAMGLVNQELLVTSAASGTSAPPDGSIYDVLNIGHGFENFYSDIAPTTAGGPDTVSDTLVTPFGDIPLMVDFHSFLSPVDLFFPY